MATKIKDGLFIGDAEASQDPEFIELNKITFVINCAGRQLPNLWEQHGLHYLTFPWTSDPECVLFDGGNVVIVQITKFIDEALEKGDSVLVHSLDGKGRCIACVAAYLMFRHRWGFEKVLDFLCNKRPDAAPNASFVQQLYHLDLRLCKQWYGHDKEPPEHERLRHNQWIPLVPDVLQKPKRRQVGEGNPSRRQNNATCKMRGKYTRAEDVGDVAPVLFGGAVLSFPSLGQLSEVEEEELVLVHSFLNSQPQIDALPPGRIDYEDHEPKELHWIDRPRIDKLSAAGRLGRNDRRQHMIPVSARTGRAVPERPGNSSYSALSRDKSSSRPTMFPPVGILKADKKERKSSPRDQQKTHLHVLEPDARGLGSTTSGNDVIAASRATSRGSKPLASTCPAPTNVEDEVVVEDLSEVRSDRWGVGGEGAEGEKLGHQSITMSNLPSYYQTQGSQQSMDSADDNFHKHGDKPSSSSRSIDNKKPGLLTSVIQDRSEREENPSASKDEHIPFSHSSQLRNPVAAARQQEKQAWDGGMGVDPGSDKTRGHDRVRVDHRGEKIETQSTIARSNEKTSSPLRAPPASTSNQPPKDSTCFEEQKPILGASTRWDGKGAGGESCESRQHDALRGKNGERKSSNTAIEVEAACTSGVKTATLAKPNTRRRDSEGSLILSGMEFSKSTSLLHDKTSLPQAPVNRAINSGNSSSSESPGPGWGPVDTQHDGQAAGGQQQVGGEGTGLARGASYGKGRGGGEKGASETGLYTAGSCGGSLEQLAQTPNPQQRRLPSPRLQHEHSQGGRRQGVSNSGYIFAQKRPNSAPSQRPDSPESGINSDGISGDWATGNTTNTALSEAVTKPPPSSFIGATNQGYPPHGLMPSGLISQLNDHGSSRWGAATGGSTPRLRPSQAQDVSLGDGGSRGIDVHRPGSDRDSSGGGLPREIRTSQPATSPTEPSHIRGGESTAPTTSEHSLGNSGTDFTRFQGGRRLPGSSGKSASSQVKSGILQPSTGPLSLSSQKRSSSNGAVASSNGGSSSDAGRWADPAPRGRQGEAGSSAGPYFCSRSIDCRGSGSSSISIRASKNPAEANSPALSQRPQASHTGTQRSHRAGGAPTYRSGSPAPARGRKSSASALAATAPGVSDPSRFLHQQILYGSRQPQQQTSGKSPGFKGYILPSGRGGGGGDSIGHTITTRRSQIPPPTSRDRRRRVESDGIGRQDTSQRWASTPGTVVPRLSAVTDGSPAQRPSTSEGIVNGGGVATGGGGGRRGRSPSPAPRPSSASGRRRSSSPSPANLHGTSFGRVASGIGVPTDPNFDRPRWK